MFVRANFVDIHSQGMRDRSMRSETELAQEIKLADWSMAGNLSNRSPGVQIPRDICTRLKRYLYSAKCSWIISLSISLFCVSRPRYQLDFNIWKVAYYVVPASQCLDSILTRDYSIDVMLYTLIKHELLVFDRPERVQGTC